MLKGSKSAVGSPYPLAGVHSLKSASGYGPGGSISASGFGLGGPILGGSKSAGTPGHTESTAVVKQLINECNTSRLED